MKRCGSAVGALAASICSYWPAGALASGVVGNQQISASVLPLELPPAVVPIELAGAVERLEVQRTAGRSTVVTVSADVLFASGKATLTPTAARTIANLARGIRAAPGATLRVDGYTDSIGAAAYNRRLSLARAQAVAAALGRDLSDGGGPRIVPRGHGAGDPVAPNTTNG